MKQRFAESAVLETETESKCVRACKLDQLDAAKHLLARREQQQEEERRQAAAATSRCSCVDRCRLALTEMRWRGRGVKI